MTENKVVWEKLVFPDDVKEEEKEHDDEEEYPTYEEDSDEPNVLTQILNSQQNPFVQLKTYNFWTLHTNFILSTAIIIAISIMKGVESIDVVSPYRVHISIGKVFDENETKIEIQRKLLEIVNEKNRS